VRAAGLVAARLTTRPRLPPLVLFCGLEMLVGSDGLRVVPFNDYRLVRMIGTIALVQILLAGGLVAAGWHELRPCWCQRDAKRGRPRFVPTVYSDATSSFRDGDIGNGYRDVHFRVFALWG
jgi:hypothetical protein